MTQTSGTYNILLFGESGAGKSTTINALANYLRYASFGDASVGDFVKRIPSKITLLDPKTYRPLVIQDEVESDSDQNERHNENGSSVTQSPKHYDFEFGEDKKRIRIIDTPGMGDTGGLDVDKKNFSKILQHLKEFDTLHGICFLIKTNATRKTAVFGYCLNELLVNLPRSASKNIVFCFTFCRNSLYGPGDGFVTLKGFLEENKLGCDKIDLKTGENCFFIDNEAFRFLLAKKHGYPFTQDKAEFYKESWDNSVDQMLNMVKKITTLEPTKLELTFRLIDAKKQIKELQIPIDNLKQKIGKIPESIAIEKNIIGSLRIKKGNQQQINSANKRINTKRVLQKEYQEELNCIHKHLCQLLQFVGSNANFNCQNLLKPYREMLEKYNNQTNSAATNQQQTSNSRVNSTGGSKRRKGAHRKVTHTASNSPNIKPTQSVSANSNEIKIDDLKLMQNELIKLKHSGEQLRNIFGIPKPEEHSVVSPKPADIPKPTFSTAVQNGKATRPVAKAAPKQVKESSKNVQPKLPTNANQSTRVEQKRQNSQILKAKASEIVQSASNASNSIQKLTNLKINDTAKVLKQPNQSNQTNLMDVNAGKHQDNRLLPTKSTTPIPIEKQEEQEVFKPASIFDQHGYSLLDPKQEVSKNIRPYTAQQRTFSRTGNTNQTNGATTQIKINIDFTPGTAQPILNVKQNIQDFVPNVSNDALENSLSQTFQPSVPNVLLNQSDKNFGEVNKTSQQTTTILMNRSNNNDEITSDLHQPIDLRLVDQDPKNLDIEKGLVKQEQVESKNTGAKLKPNSKPSTTSTERIKSPPNKQKPTKPTQQSLANEQSQSKVTNKSAVPNSPNRTNSPKPHQNVRNDQKLTNTQNRPNTQQNRRQRKSRFDCNCSIL